MLGETPFIISSLMPANICAACASWAGSPLTIIVVTYCCSSSVMANPSPLNSVSSIGRATTASSCSSTSRASSPAGRSAMRMPCRASSPSSIPISAAPSRYTLRARASRASVATPSCLIRSSWALSSESGVAAYPLRVTAACFRRSSASPIVADRSPRHCGHCSRTLTATLPSLASW